MDPVSSKLVGHNLLPPTRLLTYILTPMEPSVTSIAQVQYIMLSIPFDIIKSHFSF